MYAIAARNIAFDTHLRIDEVSDCVRYHRLAELTWNEIQASSNCAYSDDYRDGFIDGFAHYMWTNGPTTAPPMPPSYYWRPEYESAAGHQDIQDWYAGYARGAEVAKAGGFHQAVTVPTPHVAAGTPAFATAAPASPEVMPPPTFDPVPAESPDRPPVILPQPKPLAPSTVHDTLPQAQASAISSPVPDPTPSDPNLDIDSGNSAAAPGIQAGSANWHMTSP